MSNELPSFLFSANTAFIEDLYESYLKDPESISGEWRAYFDQLQNHGGTGPRDIPHGPVQARFAGAQRGSAPMRTDPYRADLRNRKQVAVLQLINAFRFRGHRQADLDPLHQHERPDVPELDPAFHGLTPDDLDSAFNTGSLVGPVEATLRDVLAILRDTYCRTIGAEYMHITDTAQKRWIQRRLEPTRARPKLSYDERRQILERVIAAGALEEFLHTKYVGQKRFSLEGGESLIPLLDELVMAAGESSVKEVVIGMAHRGRLNVLVNILGKSPMDLFEEFEGKGTKKQGSGDVKYHLGYSSDIATPGGPVHLTLAFNPSHLEIIDPVVEGSVRARQERRHDATRTQVVPILLHGDAAFAGQGVVMETLSLSQTRGHSTGGTVHIIVNNQIGFTTSDPLDARSTLYCSDVAKMVQAPIFHVNADDPEAVSMLARIALDFRMEFKKDVVIDLVCYRKHGHSEADEPAATQPLMYRKIRSHPGVIKLYSDKLMREGIVADTDVAAMKRAYVTSLQANEAVSRPLVCNVRNDFAINYEPYKGTSWMAPVETRIGPDRVQALSERITDIPADFHLHRSVEKVLEGRRQMGAGRQAIDWGYAETLAYASLVEEGHPVRLSGQDSGRGTFFHRHAVLHEQENGQTYLPLQHIREGQATFLVINSILSEEAVLGFEYGYSSAEPNALVIWEAQFGDFANGAQVVIDQFISSCEAKWGRHCGLVLLLPHGYDGQGPEHSSARLERYLQLCSEENMQVCYPSTPAQVFHLLRRQVLRAYRRPLIVMTPKSLLRHKLSVSTLQDISGGGFRCVIDDVDPLDAASVERILICSGKVYFDLLEARRTHKCEHTAIIRIEQLYPFPREDVQATINRYPNATDVVWVQEEPRNQGAWFYLMSRSHLSGCIGERHKLSSVARPYSASPAVGYMWKHLEQQQAIVTDALRLPTVEHGQEQKKTA